MFLNLKRPKNRLRSKRPQCCLAWLRRASHSCIYLLFLLVLAAFSSAAQTDARNIASEIALLRNSLVSHHVEPRQIDDRFSADLFDKMIDDLDPDRIYFSKVQIAALQVFRDQLDDEINGKESGFLSAVQDQFRKGLERSEKLINTVLETPLEWEKKETYSPGSEWAEGDQQLLARHRQWLKDKILGRLTELRARDSVATTDFFNRNLDEAIAYVRVVALRPIRRMLKDRVTFENQLMNSFLNEMAGMFDPHSAFFSAQDYAGFIASLSTEGYYFGFTLADDAKGNVVISALAPGGAAWKSGALHVSDVVVSLKWPREEKIDVQGMSAEDVVQILDENDENTLELEIRAPNGTGRQVTLRKEKLEVDENAVQSFILRSDISIGYIYLPDFYTRWEDQQAGAQCANDVAREIIRLGRDGIQGLILDLRFNGGGSLFEAQAMAGIFIDEGPLAMMRGREGKAITIKDMNRGTVYDGPLVVLVNGYSASASEVLAAAIQDYNRGLILGGRTYGKATGQDMFPLEGIPSSSSSKKGAVPGVGYAKVTTERLYRVTGKSAQRRGVIPDVSIPDIAAVLNVRESETPFALKTDSIPMNVYYKPLKHLDIKDLQVRSRERIAKSKDFQEMERTIAWLGERMKDDKKAKLLVWQSYLDQSLEARKHTVRQELRGDGDTHVYDVLNGSSKDMRLAVDEYARTTNERWKNTLGADITLQEAFHILHDQITMNKKPRQ